LRVVNGWCPGRQVKDHLKRVGVWENGVHVCLSGPTNLAVEKSGYGFKDRAARLTAAGQEAIGIEGPLALPRPPFATDRATAG
jgi:hypothetical protein